MVATLAYSSKLHAKRAENYKFILYNGLRKIRSEATAKMAVKNNQKRAGAEGGTPAQSPVSVMVYLPE